MGLMTRIKHSSVLLVALMILTVSELIVSEMDLISSSSFVVQKITTETLEQERVLFEKFIESYCGICLQQPVVQKMVSEAFRYEELSFAQADPATLFFHALHEDQVVGYISCDLLPGYQVRIRQLAFDPQMFDVTLVKELLFAVFATVPKTKHVTVCCPLACLELTALFEDLGFVRSTGEARQAIELCAVYELKIHQKCKICDVLYADIWDNEEDIDLDLLASMDNE